MRDMKKPAMKTQRIIRLTVLDKRGLMVRRSVNHNVHVITPHGKIQSGRKGRRG